MFEIADVGEQPENELKGPKRWFDLTNVRYRVFGMLSAHFFYKNNLIKIRARELGLQNNRETNKAIVLNNRKIKNNPA